MRNKPGIIIVIALVVGTIGYALVTGTQKSPQPTQTTDDKTAFVSSSSQPDNDPSGNQPREAAASGRYSDFTSSRQMEQGFDTTILFFYANWCPECRGFDQKIQSEEIPDGTQILRVNYDDSETLKQRYGVTIQTTFVSVTSNGDLVKKWVGYGQDKSIKAILQNVGN